MGRTSAKWVAFWVAVGLFGLITALGTYGFTQSCGYPASSPAARLDAIYRALQLYLLNYVPYECHGLQSPDMNEALQSARFIAPAFATGAVILSLVEPLRDYLRLVWQRLQAHRRVIVIGYGAPGEAIARRFAQSGPVTVIAREPESRGRLRPPLGRLLVSDGSDGLKNALTRVHAQQAKRVFITGTNDMQALDAAHETQAWFHLRAAAPDIRLILREPEIAREISDVSASGGGVWRGLSAFAVPQMAAEGLVQRARFDRTALEANQSCVHIALFGGSDQGEAIITEVLLTAWRVDLGPPRISLFDAAPERLETRLRALAPAMFAGRDGAGLPPESAPKLDFYRADFNQVDVGAPGSPLAQLTVPVTGYVLAYDDDTLNFRAAMELESAMLLQRLAAAPIYVRLWNAHQGAAANPGFSATSLIKPFGSLNALLDQGMAFVDTPDGQARHLHHAYLQTGKSMQQSAWAAGESFRFSSASWDELPETLRISNRRLHRHSVQKLEDLGLQWRLDGLKLPTISDLDRAALMQSPQLDAVARREHDRWMCERALDTWVPAPKRDNVRRFHPAICGWERLDPMKKNYDKVFALSLLEHGDAGAKARARHLVGMVLAPLAASKDGSLGWQISLTLADGDPAATELVIGIAWPPHGADNPANLSSTQMQAAAKALQQTLSTQKRLHDLFRLRFVYTSPPDEILLRLVDQIALEAKPKGCEISVQWLWGINAPTPLPPGEESSADPSIWTQLGLGAGGAHAIARAG